MKLERVFLFALCIGCLFWLADDASAATIHVRQDGTGDADNIQDGIYMADVADTVLVQAMLDAGARPGALDSHGRTAAQYARHCAQQVDRA